MPRSTTTTDDRFELLALLPQRPVDDVLAMSDLEWDHDRLMAAVAGVRLLGIAIDTRNDRLAIAAKDWERSQLLAQAYVERTYN